MNEAWFSLLCELVEEHTGVAIGPGKQYLAQSRLSPLLSRYEAEGIAALVTQATSGKVPELARGVVEAMMTGETLFFRDHSMFDHFRREILPAMMKAREQERSLRIWCSACSSGQEPYTVAMILDDFSEQLRGWRVDLFASDVSASALVRARTGRYNQFEVQRGLPVTHLLRYFHRDGDQWEIAEHLRSRIEFVHGSLMQAPCGREEFDIIFCRNVLMYFSNETRLLASKALDRQLHSDGWLVLGTSESGIIKHPGYRNCREYPAIFRKQPVTALKPVTQSVLTLES